MFILYFFLILPLLIPIPLPYCRRWGSVHHVQGYVSEVSCWYGLNLFRQFTHVFGTERGYWNLLLIPEDAARTHLGLWRL